MLKEVVVFAYQKTELLCLSDSSMTVERNDYCAINAENKALPCQT